MNTLIKYYLIGIIISFLFFLIQTLFWWNSTPKYDYLERGCFGSLGKEIILQLRNSFCWPLVFALRLLIFFYDRFRQDKSKLSKHNETFISSFLLFFVKFFRRDRYESIVAEQMKQNQLKEIREKLKQVAAEEEALREKYPAAVKVIEEQKKHEEYVKTAACEALCRGLTGDTAIKEAAKMTIRFEIEEEFERLINSDMLGNFVRRKKGTWNHEDWLSLLADIRNSGYRKIEAFSYVEIGRLLELEKDKFFREKFKEDRDLVRLPIERMQAIKVAFHSIEHVKFTNDEATKTAWNYFRSLNPYCAEKVLESISKNPLDIGMVVITGRCTPDEFQKKAYNEMIIKDFPNSSMFIQTASSKLHHDPIDIIIFSVFKPFPGEECQKLMISDLTPLQPG
jgi:hypothetical protein